jgi:hypothetical protein
MILGLEQRRHHNLFRLIVDGRTLEATDDHPFLLENGTWAAIEPAGGKPCDGLGRVRALKVGDRLLRLAPPRQGRGGNPAKV